MENMGGSLFSIVAFLCFTYTIAYENVMRFHSADRQTIVQTHNNLRRSIYNAANMRELTWNHAVAHAAAEWAQKCEYISRPDNQWGQNMNYFYGREADQDPIALFRESFKGWSDDSERVQYDYRRYRYCGRKHVCSYVQLIAADAQEVGCALVTCPRLQLREPEDIKKNAKLLVCFYTPWVNIVGNEVFIPQKRCDACPAGTRCVDNLCSARFGTSSSGTRPLPSLGAPALQIAGKSGSRDTVLRNTSDHSSGKQKHRSSNRHIDTRQESRRSNSYSEHRGNPDTYAEQTSLADSDNPTIIYTPNNRVVPFPGREESRDIKHITRLERRRQRKNQRRKQAELVDTPITVAEGPDKEVSFSVTNKTENASSRKKRQVDSRYYDVRYLRRLEYERYLRERQRRIRERYEAERRRNEEARRLEEERRLRAARRRLRSERAQALRRAQSLTIGEGELTGEEQFFIISAHNLLRQEVGAKALAWNSRLERWARYVIRCDVEYPGPITAYSNFGKAEAGQDIYNVVYNWGAEGNDVNRNLRYGCRTPYDKSRCNHNTIIITPELTQMACAALNCRSRRQLTCVYNDA